MIGFKQFLIETTGFDEPTHDPASVDDLPRKLLNRALTLSATIARTSRQVGIIMQRAGIHTSSIDSEISYGASSTDENSGDYERIYECAFNVRRMLKSLATGEEQLSTSMINSVCKQPTMRVVRIYMQSIPENLKHRILSAVNTNNDAESKLAVMIPFIIQQARDSAKAKSKSDADKRAQVMAQPGNAITNKVPDQIKPHLVPLTKPIVLVNPREPANQLILKNPANVRNIFNRYTAMSQRVDLVTDPSKEQEWDDLKKVFASHITQYDGDLEQSNLFGFLKLVKMGPVSTKIKSFLNAVHNAIGVVKWRVIYTYVPGGIPGLGDMPYLRFILISDNGLVALTDEILHVSGFAQKMTYSVPVKKMVDFLNEPLPRVSKPPYRTILTDLTTL